MTIGMNGMGGARYGYLSGVSGGGPRMGGPGGQGGPSFEQMQQKMTELKSTNPELAAKMEKMGARMQEMQKGGVSMDQAFSTIQAEFGTPTESDMAALGIPKMGGGSRGLGGFQSGQGPIDVTAFLSSQGSANNSIMDLLGGRNDKAA